MSKLKMALYAGLGSLVTVLIWSFIGGCQTASEAPQPPPPAPLERADIRPEEEPELEVSERETLVEEGIIPAEKGEKELPQAAPPAPEPEEVSEEIEYTVSKGDTLWGISRKYGVTVKEIQDANGITDASRIGVGQKLIIPR